MRDGDAWRDDRHTRRYSFCAKYHAFVKWFENQERLEHKRFTILGGLRFVLLVIQRRWDFHLCIKTNKPDRFHTKLKMCFEITC